MGAQKGNQFWKLRSKHGADAIFESPEIMQEACMEYFEETSKRKWFKAEAIKGGKEVGKTINVPTETPFSISGLCLFLGVNTRYFEQFEKSETYKNNKDYSTIITRVKDIIETHQLEGAIVGAFNPNIIARKLGLTDKTDISSSDGTMSPKPNIIVQSKEASDEINKLMNG